MEEITKSKKRKIGIPFLIISILLSAIIAGSTTFILMKSNSDIGKISSKLKQIDALINSYYIGEIDYEALDNAVLSGYMKALDDKYGFYKSTEDAKAVSDSFVGDASGIGVTVIYDEDNGFYIYRVDNSGPAASAGINVGDVITAIDGKSVKDLGYEKSLSAIKKELGETVKLDIQRGGKASTLSVTYKDFVRQTVYYHTIDNIGYICFTSFNSSTVQQFKLALEDLISQNVTGLIFDVRDNGGGTVDSVNEILDMLLPECDIMTVEYVDGEKTVIYSSDAKEIKLPMVVLTNKNTASASELFAASIRDMNKGILIGNTTYGKGVMQRTYFLEDGSCVRFTVGKFYPPGGVCFNEVGLEPDINVVYTEEQEADYYTLGDNDPYIKKATEYIKELG